MFGNVQYIPYICTYKRYIIKKQIERNKNGKGIKFKRVVSSTIFW